MVYREGNESLQALIGIDEIAAFRTELNGARLAFVPTMGALHEGHLSLCDIARQHADVVLVSIFVNPLQFGPSEDFGKYPRGLKKDIELLRSRGVDAVFTPTVATIYPENFQTRVLNLEMANDLCGASRPGHFEGVLTVVVRLLNLVRPEVAVFGKKDYQQWRLIEQTVGDLAMPVKVIGADIVREPDGLAMSSRNSYLKDEQRQQAAGIYRALLAVDEKFKGGVKSIAELQEEFVRISVEAGIEPEYCEIRQQKTLQLFEGDVDAPAVVLVAGRVGETRLIDNKELQP